MKATEAKLLEFLRKSPQFVIPIYQRTYSWTESECRQLWDDIIRCGNDDRIVVHFIGSIVYIESGLSQVSHQAPLLVIDGQQRLTTVSLLLTALAEAVGEEEPFEGFTARKIRNYFLLNTEETGDRHFKLLLSQTDKASLTALVGQGELPKEHSLRVVENFNLFKGWLSQAKEDLATVCKGITKLVIVDIALNREQDNPQLIFESMNSTGKELSQADLIRNYFLMGLEPALQTRLYENYWRPMETDFGQEAYGTHFDAFMRHYLTTKTGDIPRIDEVYDAFKQYAHTSFTAVGDTDATEALVKDVRNFAKYFCAMALAKEEEPGLRRAFKDLRELKVDVAFPFLLELYADYKAGLISQDDCLRAVRFVEAYVFRRAVCNVPTNSMNKTFATFMKAVNKERYLESIEAQFMLLPSYRRFPSDDEFHREIQQRDLYNFRSRAYWLRKFENFGRKEFVPVEEYTIEHILPQNENLVREWQAELGEEWQRIQQTWLHTLGNLTLTAYNAEYSDRPFAEKRDMAGGFKESPLRLNKGLGDISKWDEAAIKERASRLATQAVEVWSSPRLPAEIVGIYREKRGSATTYTREDHQHLLNPVTGPIFDAFRKAVLALDPCVTEEFLKLYVAYKAETNFVDVVPQAKGIRLALNMKFGDIIDPKGLCRDVTNMGRWGNGDVEIKLPSLEELPYVIGLVRQSLDQQLGASADT